MWKSEDIEISNKQTEEYLKKNDSLWAKWSWICDLWRREFIFGTRDEASGTQRFMQEKFYYHEIGIVEMVEFQLSYFKP